MNEKIPVNRLAQDVAGKLGCEPSEAQQFVKDLFAYVESEVSAGNDVTIPGLGRFAKSTTPSEPIAFEPDAEYAAELNADFEMFSPTELYDGVTEEALDAVCTTDSENSEETGKGQKPESDKEQSAQTESEPETVTETETEMESETEIVNETEPETKESETQAVEENPSENDPESVAVNTEVTEVLIATEEIQETSPAPESAPVEESDNADTKAEPQEEEIPDMPAQAVPQIAPIPEQDEEYVIVHTRKSRFWTGFIIGLILGFALGVIAFVAYLVNISVITPEKLFN